MQGIYKLVFLDGSFYIGQSSNLDQRVASHKASRGKGSPRLEQAFKISELVSVEVIEECRLEELNDREKFWIKELKPSLNTLEGGTAMSGFNHPKSKYSKEQILEIVKLYTETDLSFAQIVELTGVASGTVHDVCKGRSHTWATASLNLESIRAAKAASKSVTVYDPDNNKYLIEWGDFNKFSKEHPSISVNTLIKFRDRTHNKTRNGWSTYFKIPIELKVVSDEGIEFSGTKEEITNIMRECGLAQYSITRVLEGHTSKGWTLKQNE